MSSKSEVLKVLEQNREKKISGQALADKLGISRTAVHKCITELRRDGYVIEAVTSKGYCLAVINDIISAEGIGVFLGDESTVGDIFVHKAVTSTNQVARQLAMDGAKSGTVIISEEQTAGRGRMGRKFFSPPGSGIYLSIILRPKMNAIYGGLITTAASVAVCRALEKGLGITPKIKWVNDILFNGRKVCGILTEAATDFESGNIEYVILGIGINVTTLEFPEEIKMVAGSLLPGCNEGVSRNKLIAEVLKEFFAISLSDIEGGLIAEYKKRLIMLNREITFSWDGREEQGTAVDVDDLGGLIVEMKNGERQTLSSGEISISTRLKTSSKTNQSFQSCATDGQSEK